MRRKMHHFCCCLPLLFFSFGLSASEGHTFSIEETPFRPTIRGTVSIDYEKIAEQAKTPTPVQGIGETTTYRAFYFDPTYTVATDIQDLKGNYLAKKGQTIDPMQHIDFLPDLIFFDGTKKDQIAWAKGQPRAKWILIKGSPIKVEEETEHPTYFDQLGELCKRFGLKNVPCTVSKKDNKILIQEIPIRDLP